MAVLLVVIAAAEEPGFRPVATGLMARFGPVVAEHQSAVFEKARQCVSMVVRVLDGCAHEAALGDERGPLLLDSRKECSHVRPKVHISKLLDFRRRPLLPRCIEFEESANAYQSFTRDRTFGDGCLPEAATHVIPASDFDALGAVVFHFVTRVADCRFVGEEQIEHALGVCLDVAAEAAKAAVNCGARFSLEVIEQNVVAVGDLDQEVALLTRLRRTIGAASAPLSADSFITVRLAIAPLSRAGSLAATRRHPHAPSRCVTTRFMRAASSVV